ncbi:MAG: iron ABC transporter permease [Phycisphaerales bacterium]|nr:iron ABC transporter permease [Phycisphaerales bacterium]
MSARTTRALIQYSLMGGLLFLLAVFLLYPIGLTVRGGFAEDVSTGDGWTLDHLMLVFRDPLLIKGIVNAFKIAITTTLLCIIVSLPLAVLSANFSFPGKKLLNAMILVPLILPPFVGAIGIRALLGRAGALNALFGTDWDVLGATKFWGVVAVLALHLYPIIYLNATASLANLDPALDESAENLGAGPWRRFFTITLPLIRPGLFAGATIVFIWSFTELGTPLMFDYSQVTSVQIFYGLKEVQNSAEPYALTLVLLVSAILFYVMGKLVFGRKGYAMYSKASRAGGETPLGRFWGWAAAIGFGLVTLLAVMPHIGVVLTAFAEPGSWYESVLPGAFTGDHFAQALTAGESFTSIKNSIILSLLAMILNMGFGVLIGYILVRTTIKGRGVLDALCMLPLAVPGLVMAFGYVAMTLRWPFDGSLHFLGMNIPAFFDGTRVDLEVFGQNPNPFPLLIVAYAVRRLPYIVRSTVSGLEQTSGELEEAAVNLGATRVTAVRKVIVPLIMANLIAGGLLVFSFSMLEVSDSLILAQKGEHFPITKMIYEFTTRLGDGPYIASAMGVWGMCLLTVTLFGASLLLGKKMGSIFRV